MIVEKEADTLLTYESQPDGGQTPIIDPYDGCSIACPYCFNLHDGDWNKAIHVRTGIDELIGPVLAQWPKEETIYLGSRCDPYMELERQYLLTRRCLRELARLGIQTMVTTKGETDLILRDMDIYAKFQGSLVVLLGFARLSDYLRSGTGVRDRIDTARTLIDNDIRVWAFVTPVLPGGTDVEYIRSELPESVPIFLDRLRLGDSVRQRERIMAAIRTNFPRLSAEYDSMLITGGQPYYAELIERYGRDERITFLFSGA